VSFFIDVLVYLSVRVLSKPRNLYKIVVSMFTKRWISFPFPSTCY